jgi:hypothetical protein
MVYTGNNNNREFIICVGSLMPWIRILHLIYNINYRFITTAFHINTTEICLFRGFYYILSLIVNYKYILMPHNDVVLNSAPLLLHANNTTLQRHYTTENSYLSIGTTRKHYLQKLKNTFQSAINQSEQLYPYYNDFNDLIKHEY